MLTTLNGSQIRGRVLDSSHLKEDAALTNGQLLNGINYFYADGSRPMSGNLNMKTGATSYRITNLANPIDDLDGVNKAYVDSVAQGLDPKESCRIATSANVALSGTQTIDGVSLNIDDRVLVKAQTDATENGIYLVKAGAWVRALDFVDGSVTSGAFTFIEEGDLLHDTGWVLSTAGTIIVGTTELTFTQFSAAGVLTAGNGITITNNLISVQAYLGILVDSNGVSLKQTVDGGLDTNVNGAFIKLQSLKGLATTTSGLGVVAGNGIEFNGTTGGVQVKPQANKGLSVTTEGVAVVLEASKGLAVDSNGISVVLAQDYGIKVDASGLYLDIRTNGGLTVDSTGLGVLAGYGTEVNSLGVNVKPVVNGSISSTASGVSVICDPARGVVSTSLGLAVLLETAKGLSQSSSGLAVVAANGIQISASGVGVKLDTNSGLYVDSNGLGINFVRNEIVTGTIDGVNDTFTLASLPVPGSVNLFYNGQLLDPNVGNDYSLSGQTITTYFAPVPGDKLRAEYFIQ